jgi:hypothetical protein
MPMQLTALNYCRSSLFLVCFFFFYLLLASRTTFKVMSNLKQRQDDFIGYRSTIKRTSHKYRADGMTQKQQHKLLVIRSEGESVQYVLNHMNMIRDGVLRALEVVRGSTPEDSYYKHHLRLTSQLRLIDNEIQVKQRYYTLLANLDFRQIAIYRGQRPYESLAP